MDRWMVLLVDGDRDTRNIFRVVLEHHGYRVREAEDGAEALRLIAEDRPDLVVVDFPVPLPGGLTFTETLKRDSRTGTIPVLTVTARAFPEQLDAARRAGSDLCLTKPIAPTHFMEEVGRSLGAPRVA